MERRRSDGTNQGACGSIPISADMDTETVSTGYVASGEYSTGDTDKDTSSTSQVAYPTTVAACAEEAPGTSKSPPRLEVKPADTPRKSPVDKFKAAIKAVMETFKKEDAGAKAPTSPETHVRSITTTPPDAKQASRKTPSGSKSSTMKESPREQKNTKKSTPGLKTRNRGGDGSHDKGVFSHLVSSVVKKFKSPKKDLRPTDTRSGAGERITAEELPDVFDLSLDNETGTSRGFPRRLWRYDVSMPGVEVALKPDVKKVAWRERVRQAAAARRPVGDSTDTDQPIPSPKKRRRRRTTSEHSVPTKVLKPRPSTSSYSRPLVLISPPREKACASGFARRLVLSPDRTSGEPQGTDMMDVEEAGQHGEIPESTQVPKTISSQRSTTIQDAPTLPRPSRPFERLTSGKILLESRDGTIVRRYNFMEEDDPLRFLLRNITPREVPPMLPHIRTAADYMRFRLRNMEYNDIILNSVPSTMVTPPRRGSTPRMQKRKARRRQRCITV